MNKADWKTFHSSIRRDARSFGGEHGGYPCFRRHFRHLGKLFCVVRYHSYDGWHTHITRDCPDSALPISQRIATRLASCAFDRAQWSAMPWTKGTRRPMCRMSLRAIQIIRAQHTEEA